MKATSVTARLLLGLVAVLLVCTGFELYLRKRRAHIMAQDAGLLQRLTGLGAQDPGMLIRYTPQGRRRMPNAKVVIKNDALAGHDILMQFNSYGFRGPEISPEKARHELRILALGDSITAAHYLDEPDTWVRKLENDLAPRIKSRPVELLNAGLEDTGTKEQVDILSETGVQVNPDVVVLAWYLNDSRPPWGFPGELGASGWLRRNSLLADTVYRNLKLASWVKEHGTERFEWSQVFDKVDWKNDPAAYRRLVESARYDWGAAWRDDSWPLIETEFARLRKLSEERKFRVAVAVFPVSFQVYSHVADDAPQRRLRALVDRFGFGYLDLLPVFRAHAAEDPALFFDNCHPKAPANAFAGKAIAEYLRNDVLRDVP